MNVLIVAPFFPFPLTSGGHTRLFNLIRHLSKRHTIDFISPATSGEKSFSAELAKYCRNIVLIDRDEAASSKTLNSNKLRRNLRRITGIFKGIPLEASGFYFPELREKLETLLNTTSYDIVQVELARMALNFSPEFFRDNSVRKVLVDYDLTFIPHLRRYQCERRFFPRLFRYADYRMTRAFARRTWCMFDTLIVMSDVDQRKAAELTPGLSIQVVPNGVDLEFFEPQPCENSAGNLLFIGGAGHYANVDALFYFLKEIFPKAKARIGNLALTVIGEGWERYSDALGRFPSLTLTGFVEDVRPYAAKSAALIAPIRIGGGTRLKILEAMALGIPVVSTTIGCEGIPVVAGKHALLADTPDEFVARIEQIANTTQVRGCLTQHAYSLVEMNYSWEILAEKTEAIYDDLLR